jgi:hypothetical protein
VCLLERASPSDQTVQSLADQAEANYDTAAMRCNVAAGVAVAGRN